LWNGVGVVGHGIIFFGMDIFDERKDDVKIVTSSKIDVLVFEGTSGGDRGVSYGNDIAPNEVEEPCAIMVPEERRNEERTLVEAD
jgi:hypothetical protein